VPSSWIIRISALAAQAFATSSIATFIISVPVPVPPYSLERQREQVVLGEQPPQVPRVGGLLVDLGSPRGDPLDDDPADRVAELDHLGRQGVACAERCHGLILPPAPIGSRAVRVCSATAMNAFEDPAIEISPQRAAELLGSGATVVDVRETYEREAGYIEGTRHIELERLASRANEIDREAPVVFHCRLGARSAMAASAFRASGYDAYTMTGGIQAWVDAGLPIMPQGGYVADH
jgi:rhodanese-related sulfurtransferase